MILTTKEQTFMYTLEQDEFHGGYRTMAVHRKSYRSSMTPHVIIKFKCEVTVDTCNTLSTFIVPQRFAQNFLTRVYCERINFQFRELL